MHLPANLQQRAAQFVTQNATGMLTAAGVVGVAATAVLTARATWKAAGIIREKVAIQRAEYLVEAQSEEDFPPDLSKTEMVKLVWPQYVVPAAVGVGTITAIIMANRMSAKRAAALAAAYSLSESRLQEYKDKVAEKFGVRKAQDVRDEVAQDRVNKNPPGPETREVIILGAGDVLCYETLTGRYFHSSVEAIRRAESKLHNKLFQTQSCSVSEFFDEIGLDRTTFSDIMGWNTIHGDDVVDVKFSTTLTPDNRPCMVIDYSVMPNPDFNKLF